MGIHDQPQDQPRAPSRPARSRSARQAHSRSARQARSDSAAWWILPLLGHALGAMVAGGLVGGLVLPAFGSLGLSQVACVLLGAAVGGACGMARGLREIRRRQAAERLAGQRELTFREQGEREVAERLKTVLGREGFVSLENVLSGRRAGVQVVFGDLVYLSIGSRESSRRVNSIAAFQHPNLTFPRFTLRPEGGPLNVMTGWLDVEDLDFDSHPSFSRQYHLSGQDPESVRQFFQPRLLDFLDDRPGWEIRGDKDRLVILKPGQVVKSDRLDAFIDETLAILAEFEHAARARSRMAPPLPAGSKPSAAQALPGQPSAESWLLDWARRQTISPQQVEQFLRSPVPRQVPRRLLFQYLNGSIWSLGILLGIPACLGGGLAGLGVAVGEPALLVAGTGLALSVLGLLAWLIHRRNRKFHLLTNGCLAAGQIHRVETTQVAVNGQQRYLAHVRYSADGIPQAVAVPLYGGHVGLAREAAEEERPVLLLYEPQVPRRIVLDVQLVTQFPFRT